MHKRFWCENCFPISYCSRFVTYLDWHFLYEIFLAHCDYGLSDHIVTIMQNEHRVCDSDNHTFLFLFQSKRSKTWIQHKWYGWTSVLSSPIRLNGQFLVYFCSALNRWGEWSYSQLQCFPLLFYILLRIHTALSFLANW